MRTVRNNVFETNSSSTHSITMCTESEFEKWKNGEMYWNRWNEELVDKSVVEKEMARWKEDFIKDNPGYNENDPDWQDKLDDYMNEDKCYYTYQEFNSYDYLEYETYETSYKTPNGEVVKAFGYYGNDY